MRKHEIIIRKIVDHILLNACSVNLSGLYNGKAGMALALFESARYLQDEYINEQAVNLLQEALLTKTENVGFEDGLGGIGYVLLYLMHENLVDIDFGDLFGEQHDRILVYAESVKEPSCLIRLNYYLTEIKLLTLANSKVERVIKAIFKAFEFNLYSQFRESKIIHSPCNKTILLSKFECYLKTICDCNYAGYSHSLLQGYAELYRSGRIKSSFSVAYYLEKLGLSDKYNDVIVSNRQYGSQGYLLKHTSLRSLIEYAQLSCDTRFINSSMMSGNIEKAFLRHIPHGTFIAGYEQGLSRLLIYLANEKAELL